MANMGVGLRWGMNPPNPLKKNRSWLKPIHLTKSELLPSQGNRVINWAHGWYLFGISLVGTTLKVTTLKFAGVLRLALGNTGMGDGKAENTGQKRTFRTF